MSTYFLWETIINLIKNIWNLLTHDCYLLYITNHVQQIVVWISYHDVISGPRDKKAYLSVGSLFHMQATTSSLKQDSLAVHRELCSGTAQLHRRPGNDHYHSWCWTNRYGKDIHSAPWSWILLSFVQLQRYNYHFWNVILKSGLFASCQHNINTHLIHSLQWTFLCSVLGTDINMATNVKKPQGINVSILCNTSGNLTYIEWEKDETSFFAYSPTKPKLDKNFTSARMNVDPARPTVLHISHVQESDEGIYTCVTATLSQHQLKKQAWNLTIYTGISLFLIM